MRKMKYSKEDIFRMVEEEDVEFIRLQFTDIFRSAEKYCHYGEPVGEKPG